MTTQKTILNRNFEPKKLVVSPADLALLEKSECLALIAAFLEQLNGSVIGLKRSDSKAESKTVDGLLGLIANCNDAIAKYPRTEDGGDSRFGHPQFRAYYDYIDKNCLDWFKEFVSQEQMEMFGLELKTYFMHCFGDRQRIDYGTGHEFHFIIFLFCLQELNLLRKEDCASVVLHVFWAYIDWMHNLQKSYWLEPAGSHGVWGLDDYQFLPFYFGSAQLRGHKHIKPKSIHNQEILDQYSKEYLYLYCVNYVNQVKNMASLSWHSPMLNDISGVKSWDKVNSGMMKMFKVEVLSKLPIMQHLLFGRLFGKLGWVDASEEERMDFIRACNADLKTSSTLAYTLPEYQEFKPASSSASQDHHHHHHHSSGCSRDTTSKAVEEEYVEQIVRYVKNAKGGWTPIFGRVLKGTPEVQPPSENASDDSNNNANNPLLVDSYAMGQAPPVCCGIRLPSAHASTSTNDKKYMLPFD